MRDKHFLFAPTYTPLNHGSFGTYPKSVQKRFHEVQALSEARPDTFVRYQYPAMLDESRAAMAEFLGVPVDEVVFVPNATTAINVVLRSLKFEKGDVILHLSSVYGSVEKTIEYLRETTKVDRISLPVQYPIDDEALVSSFQQAIRGAKSEGFNVRIASFDTISSLPGVRVPWERLVGVCRAEGVLSMIDGAHGIGQTELDLPNVTPDFFTSNCHKYVSISSPQSDGSRLKSGESTDKISLDGCTYPEHAQCSLCQNEISTLSDPRCRHLMGLILYLEKVAKRSSTP